MKMNALFLFTLFAILFSCIDPTAIGVNAATWCVGNPSASIDSQQKDLNVLCNVVDCSPIKSGGACFQPNAVLNHVSFVYNRYYKERGSNPTTCNFGGDAMITSTDPSHGTCIFQ